MEQTVIETKIVKEYETTLERLSEIKVELKKEASELRAFFPRLDGAEMRCRFDMQLAPPDILITNFSMLSIMLMRGVDAPIFEETRQWLNCDDEYSNDATRCSCLGLWTS